MPWFKCCVVERNEGNLVVKGLIEALNAIMPPADQLPLLTHYTPWDISNKLGFQALCQVHGEFKSILNLKNELFSLMNDIDSSQQYISAGEDGTLRIGGGGGGWIVGEFDDKPNCCDGSDSILLSHGGSREVYLFSISERLCVLEKD